MANKTNYEIVMENMTPEIMAEYGVKLVNVDNRRLFYMTSSGQLFTPDAYMEALQFEYNWLVNGNKGDEACDKCEEESTEQTNVEESEK